MTKTKIIYLISFPVCVIILLFMMLGEFNRALPVDKPVPVETVNDVQIVQVTARAFNLYGTDANGIAYWHGYVVVSSKGEIRLGDYLDIDKYGPCQAMAVSDKLASNEVLLWYNSPSDVRNFGVQQAWARVLGEGERH